MGGLAHILINLKYNSLVGYYYPATIPNCGNILKLLDTTLYEQSYEGTRLMAEPNGNNSNNWIIRSQAIWQSVEGSETRWNWVNGKTLA